MVSIGTHRQRCSHCESSKIMVWISVGKRIAGEVIEQMELILPKLVL
jgi:hypothetical protein